MLWFWYTQNRLLLFTMIVGGEGEVLFAQFQPIFSVLATYFYGVRQNFVLQLLSNKCSGFCQTFYHLLTSPPLTNLPITLKIHTEDNKMYRQNRMWRQYTCYFPANGSTNPDVFQPQPFSILRGIIPQNFSSLGFAVSEELGNIQTDKQTHSLTDRLALLQSDQIITLST